jgi:hypothetical protein
MPPSVLPPTAVSRRHFSQKSSPSVSAAGSLMNSNRPRAGRNRATVRTSGTAWKTTSGRSGNPSAVCGSTSSHTEFHPGARVMT